MAAETILICHDLVPPGSPLRAALRRMVSENFGIIDSGTRMQPLTPAAMLREAGKRAPRRVFAARNAVVVREGSGTRLRSAVAVQHYVLMLLRQVELAALADRESAEEYVTEEAITAGMIADLAAERPAYPFVNMHAGMFIASAEAAPRARPLTTRECRLLAESFDDTVLVVLPDFPDALDLGLRHALAAMGLAPRPAGRMPPQEPGAGDLAGALEAWRTRLGDEPFERLCELNRGDLVLLDSVVELHGHRMGLTTAQLEAITKALDRAADVTGHRKKHRSPGQAAPPTAARTVEPPQGTLEADPVLGWRNRANARLTVSVSGRALVMETDDTGRREVPGRPATAERALAIFGCAIPFGWGVAAGETFAGILQARLPGWRVENHGVEAYGTVHSLLALRQQLRWDTPDFVTFCWSGEHRARNVAAVDFVLARTPPDGDTAGARAIAEMTPRGLLDGDGALTFQPVALPRPDLRGIDMTDFDYDPYYMELISFRLIEDAARLVQAEGGRFFLTVVGDDLSPLLAGWLEEAGILVVHGLPPSTEHGASGRGPYPDEVGHRLIAERIEALLRRETAPSWQAGGVRRCDAAVEQVV